MFASNWTVGSSEAGLRALQWAPESNTSQLFAQRVKTREAAATFAQFDQEPELNATMQSFRLFFLLTSLLSCVGAQEQSQRDRVELPVAGGQDGLPVADGEEGPAARVVGSEETLEHPESRELPYYYYYGHGKMHGGKMKGKSHKHAKYDYYYPEHYYMPEPTKDPSYYYYYHHKYDKSGKMVCTEQPKLCICSRTLV